MQLETVKVVDKLTRRNPLPAELEQFDFNPEKPDETFGKILAYIEKYLGKAIAENKPPEIVILSPFLYERYVRRFIMFVERLRRRYPKLRVMVVTRKSRHVNNRKEHCKLVKELRKAGIVVRMKAVKTKDHKEVPWHGKMVIIGTEYVIAGSVNPLAPSRFETVHVTRLVKIVRNPGTWRTLRKLLVEDDDEDDCVEKRDKLKEVKRVATPMAAAPRNIVPMVRRPCPGTMGRSRPRVVLIY